MIDTHAQQMMHHLPFLRRYARALTGSTERGDRVVTNCLEIATADPERYGLDGNSRLPLYRLLNELTADLKPDFGDGAPVHPIEEALSSLPEMLRRVYLLISLESLSTADAAEILNVPHQRAIEAMNEAQERMRDRLVANILIVEDDAIIAFDLAETIRAMGHKVCGTAATTRQALDLAEDSRPTLALMDVRLAHGDSGIATAEQLRARRSLPIIFVTAYAEEIRRRGLDQLGPVIKKPFTRDQIEQAITQAVFNPRTAEPERMAR